jgi:N-acetylglucosamine kinase-like BadF-type ATPase
LSVEALRLCTQVADGRRRATALLAAVLGHLALERPEALLSYAYAPGITKAELARLAPVVFNLAARGDRHARALVAEAAAALAGLAHAVRSRLAMDRPVMALGGSLLLHQPALRRALARRLRFSPARVVVVEEPAQGAVNLATGVKASR